MTLPRRRFLNLAAGAATLPMFSRAGRAQTMRPLAERLPDYAPVLQVRWALDRTDNLSLLLANLALSA
jgi:hypothetical protein